MPYTSAVIKESLRLCPPNPWGTNKVTTERETEMMGYKLPKGSYVETPVLPMAILERNYGTTALHFKPERWLASPPVDPTHSATVATAAAVDAPAGSEAMSSSTDSIAHISTESAAAVDTNGLTVPDPLTFMVGPRDCIGQSLARMELQVVLAVLLTRFRFHPGAKLRQELKTAESLGQSAVSAIHACAEVHVTMQPAGSQMLLGIECRS
eukprot:GHUV01047166.1.p1 GENE.GHUV01047166.1~~GHUV01047166.1.p1  ORF type:complete len:232 (+),score=52.22 GHUV01047166.1:68-697(+)